MQISMLTHTEADTEAEQRGRTLSVLLMNGRTEARPASTQSEPRPSVSDLAQQQNLGRGTLQAKISVLGVSDQRRKNAIRDQVTTEKPKGGKALPGGGRCAGEFCPLIPQRPRARSSLHLIINGAVSKQDSMLCDADIRIG